MARSVGIGEGRVVLSLTQLEADALHEVMAIVYSLDPKLPGPLRRVWQALDKAVEENKQK